MKRFTRIALAPLAIVWFGIGPGSKIAIAALMTFFPTFIGALRGLTRVDPRSLELMRSCAASEWQIFWKLRVPNSGIALLRTRPSSTISPVRINFEARRTDAAVT